MNVFDLRQRLVGDYASYTRSFIKIADPTILAKVDSELDAGAFWPEPLLQLNPTFGSGGTIDDLVADGTLHPECAKIFRIEKTQIDLTGKQLQLHKHQANGIRLAKQQKSYVLTSGTGSGKSLTYIVLIVDHVLRRGSGQGIQAIVVYPMNALANSQDEELSKFLKPGYPEGQPPVRFARYTGQEKGPERDAIRHNPPDVLTNFMMLELLLTRSDDRALVRAAQGLQFLVFDELHTYRGRQGADVAFLIRRCRQAFGGHDKTLIERLKVDDPGGYARYVEAKEMHDRTSVFFRFSGCYPLTGVSRTNLYSVFCETGLRLLSPRGRLGMVLASGIVTDDNNKDLFASLVDGGRLVHAWDFENSQGIFPGVHRSFKFLLHCAGGPETRQHQADFAFFLTDVQQLSEAERHFTLTGHELALLNPNTRTCPSFRNKREAEITKIIYRRVPAWELHEKSKVWPGTPKTPFNMANDSGLFIKSSKLRELGNQVSELAPLYESKSTFQFNHRFATFSENAEDGTTELGVAQLQDPNFSVTSRYWLKRTILNERFPGRWFFGYRMITNATNERAAVAAIIPERPCAHSLSIVEELNATGALVLLGCVNSFVYDYAARQKIAGTNFTLQFQKKRGVFVYKGLKSGLLGG